MSYPEHSLANRLLQGDADTLGQVMRWISQSLASPRYWSLRREWPDLCQEVLARVVESLHAERYDASRDLRVYVQSIARYAAWEALGRMSAAAQADPPGMAERASGGDPERAVIDGQLVRRILDLASEECREMMRSYFFEGLDYAAIAERTGVPVGTVKSRLSRCLHGIAEAMERFRALEVDDAPRVLRRASRSGERATQTGPPDT